jgi:hypothetical protein
MKIRKPLYNILTILALLFSYWADAQKGKEEFYRAASLRVQSEKLEKKDPILSDKLGDSANSIYPGIPSRVNSDIKGAQDWLPKRRFEDGNVIGANDALEKTIQLVSTLEESIYFGELYGKDLFVEKKDVLFDLLGRKIMLNLFYGSQEQAGKDILRLIELPVEKKAYDKWFFGWRVQAVYVPSMLFSFQFNAFLCQDIGFIKKLKPFFEKMGDERNLLLSEMYERFFEGKMDEIEAYRLKLNKGGYKAWNNYVVAMMYAQAGKIDGVEDLLDNKLKQQRVRLNAVTGLAKGNYDEVINSANEGLRGVRILWQSYDITDKFYLYYLRGKAYEGLKQNEKAMADYEASLLFHPAFKPAQDAIVKLESRIVTDRFTDKVPPAIEILEPAVQRGLKPKSSSREIIVKGRASDPAGLKEVSLNGNKIYSKAEGAFWGSIHLKPGVNHVKVQATDMAGNMSEMMLEIEQSGIESSEGPVKVGRNYAFLIGCQNYQDSRIPSLENPVSDAIKLKMLLRDNYGFAGENIITLFNPDRKEFKRQVLELSENMLPEDNLLIFYAGHGVWQADEKKGYWMLADAVSEDVNSWISNREVLDWLGKLPTRHILLIADACFSGSVFKTRGFDPNAPSQIQQMQNKISRVAITSGNDTAVPDQSIFMKYLLKALGDNREKYLTAQKMFINYIIEAVMSEARIEPRYGTLEMAGHVGGDFIFIKK